MKEIGSGCMNTDSPDSGHWDTPLHFDESPVINRAWEIYMLQLEPLHFAIQNGYA